LNRFLWVFEFIKIAFLLIFQDSHRQYNDWRSNHHGPRQGWSGGGNATQNSIMVWKITLVRTRGISILFLQTEGQGWVQEEPVLREILTQGCKGTQDFKNAELSWLWL